MSYACSHVDSEVRLSNEDYELWWCPSCGAVADQRRKEVSRPEKGWTSPTVVQRNLRVRNFHERFGHFVAEKVSVPCSKMVRFRMKIWWEEIREAFEAVFRETKASEREDLFLRFMRRIFDDVELVILNAPVKVDLPAFMDALEDVDYITEGHRIVFGVDGEPIAAAVHEANMAKAPNGLDKPLKPEGWKPPDVAGLLQKQGWRIP